MDPYDNIFDAIERAYELAAPTVEANITIILLGSIHYIKRELREYSYKAIDRDFRS